MKKESVMFGIIGLLLGVVITGFTAGQVVNNNNTGMMRMMGMHASNTQEATSHSDMSMTDMSKQLEGLSGDAYDKAFIEMMIDHHEGAVDMAKLSDTRAKHDETKQLSKDIITAQEKEIAEMKQWQQDWGYSSDEMMDMMHGGH
jgi:uncharacterized protein (DUF305 family)